MSLTKNQIAYLVQDLVGGGDQPVNSKYHKSNIQLITELVVNDLITAEYYRSRNEGTYDINGDFVTPYPNIDVSYDSDRDEYYSNLPSRFASLPQNRGIRLVSQMQNQSGAFIQIANGGLFAFNGLEADSLGGASGYYVEGQKIYYKNLDHVHVKQVLIKMITAVESLDEDAVIPIPSAMESLLLDKVIEKMEIPKNTPQDKTNDTNTQ